MGLVRLELASSDVLLDAMDTFVTIGMQVLFSNQDRCNEIDYIIYITIFIPCYPYHSSTISMCAAHAAFQLLMCLFL